jgi:two-component system, cell cycle sensor histidine kinase and response regulator CckA
MPAADRISTATFPAVVSFLKELIRFSRRRARDGQPAGASRDPSKVDLGDLGVAQLVHDLRNQLTLIVNYADDLIALVPTGSANAELVQLRRCAARASVLTREVLLAARPKFVARRALDLNHVVAPAMEVMSRVAGDGIQIKLHVAPVPVPVVAEFIELERIVVNLVLNSIDAIDGEGVITIETEAVHSPSPSRVEGMQEGPYARLTVTDTGRGVSPEVRARMFEPYFTTKEGGTGLGASSVAFTVRQLQGTVSVDSEPGRGTSITVLLPLSS